MIFNGREFARDKEKNLILKAEYLRKKGIIPKLVSILVGDNEGSRLYTSLKKAAAERIGAEMGVVTLQKNVKTEKLKNIISKLNKDKSVHGIMIQLPLPKGFEKGDRDRVIDSIAIEKDVDGLRDDSAFVAPVVKAVLSALQESEKIVPAYAGRRQVVVIGGKGFEGRKIVKELRSKMYDVGEVDKRLSPKDDQPLAEKTKNADVVISVTGVPDLIKPDMVKQNVVLIDVGSPKGDISKEAYEKASFVSPVHGGIGPATIACLMENLIEGAKSNKLV